MLSGRSVTNVISQHNSTSVRGGATFNRVNICANQNETLMKQIQNSQKFIGKSKPAYIDIKNLKKKIRELEVSRLFPNPKSIG
jgi:hypothetical protein